MIESQAGSSFSRVLGGALLAYLGLALSGCASLESNRIQSNLDECMAPLQNDAAYAASAAVLDPQGGITPSMLADASYPTPEQREQFSGYLDAKAICERRQLEQSAGSMYSDREKFYVLQKQYRLRWQSDANFLAGALSFGEYFVERESISQAKADQIAAIERRQALTEAERRASVQEACDAAGGRWNGLRCVPLFGDLDRKINCNLVGGTTICTPSI